MSLVKAPVKRPSAAHKKRSGAHHTQNRHYIQTYWPYLPMAFIVGVGLLLQFVIAKPHARVLSYATDMSVAELLQDTNDQRAANNVAALSLNATLNQAAQAKAHDMATNNYWAHTSPSGLTPWYFITQAGYGYTTAGENLAYGFATASDALTGWMNSPGHRANILNAAFTEVGFGIIDIPNYQSQGEQTLVVAMYAAPAHVMQTTPTVTQSTTQTTTATATPTAQATTDTVTPTTTAKTTTGATSTSAAAAASSGGGSSATQQKTRTTTSTTPVSATTVGKTPVKENTQSVAIKRIDLLTTANVAWTQFALSMVMSVAILIFLLRHSMAWHRVLVKGERFVIHHPAIDITAVAVVAVAILLLQTSGVIK